MGRLWIIFLLVWYTALSMVKTEVDLIENKSRDVVIPIHSTESTDINSFTLETIKNDYPKDVSPDWTVYDYMKNIIDNKCCLQAANDYMEYLTNNRIYQHKRSQEDADGPRKISFRPWGGKRSKSDTSIPKRVPFNSWGGKRADTVELENGSYLLDSNKRTNRQQTKKTKFHSWGGKRSEPGIERVYRDLPNGWDSIDRLSTTNEGDRNIVLPGVRRLKFSSWGGKRNALNDEDADEKGMRLDDKRTFNSWGGKRGQTFNAWGGKRNLNQEDLIEEYKRTFNSWGG